MNQKNNSPSSAPASSQSGKSFNRNHLATAALFLIVLFFWRDQSRMKGDIEIMAEQNTHLKKELSSAQSELDFFKTGDFRAASPSKDSAAESVTVKPVVETETLFLQEPSVHQTTDGLVARFEFKPDGDLELPGMVTLVVRVPGHSDAKIVSIKPVAESSYTDVSIIVDAKGKLGMIEGSPSDLEALVFELTVSAPVKALVRGSEGIKDFEIDIAASGCTVRKL